MGQSSRSLRSHHMIETSLGSSPMAGISSSWHSKRRTRGAMMFQALFAAMNKPVANGRCSSEILSSDYSKPFSPTLPCKLYLSTSEPEQYHQLNYLLDMFDHTRLLRCVAYFP